MKLTSKQNKYLRALGHKLNPVVTVGIEGVSTGVNKEIEATLTAHELIKVRLRCEDQGELKQLIAEIVAAHDAQLVQVIGHTLILYREGSEDRKTITLP